MGDEETLHIVQQSSLVLPAGVVRCSELVKLPRKLDERGFVGGGLALFPPPISHLSELLSEIGVATVTLVARSAEGGGILQRIRTPVGLRDDVVNFDPRLMADNAAKLGALLGFELN